MTAAATSYLAAGIVLHCVRSKTERVVFCMLSELGNSLSPGPRAIASERLLCVGMTEYTSKRYVGRHVLYVQDHTRMSLTFISSTLYHTGCLQVSVCISQSDWSKKN